jgi:hypothetical protein
MAPPTPTPTPNPPEDVTGKLRLRLWIGGKLFDETWIDARDPDAGQTAELVSIMHTDAVRIADDNGTPWLAEVFDPEAPEEAGCLRWGTDPAGMVQPVPITWTVTPW